jgi:low temperature requirement protein LtrA
VIAVHFVAAMIYLGITFRFQKYNSRVYVAWYVIGGCELLINVMLSLLCDVLSFKGTHLIQRFSLLTFIIMGEGIIVVANNISLIVKNPNSWSELNQLRALLVLFCR